MAIRETTAVPAARRTSTAMAPSIHRPANTIARDGRQDAPAGAGVVGWVEVAGLFSRRTSGACVVRFVFDGGASLSLAASIEGAELTHDGSLSIGTRQVGNTSASTGMTSWAATAALHTECRTAAVCLRSIQTIAVAVAITTEPLSAQSIRNASTWLQSTVEFVSQLIVLPSLRRR